MKKLMLLIFVIILSISSFSVSADYNVTSFTVESLDGVFYPTRDLTAHWKLEGNANDETGFHNGTITGATSNSTGGFDGGGAYEFDGNDYIQFADSDRFSPDAMTISAWIKPDSLSGSDAIVTKYNSNTGNSEFAFVTTGDEIQLVFDDSGLGNFGGDQAATFETYTANLVVGSWYHVSFVLDDTTNYLKLYINGKSYPLNQTAGNPINIGNFNSPLRIGSMICGAGSLCNYMDGTIDEVKMYSYVLDDYEVKQLYLDNAYSSNRDAVFYTNMNTNYSSNLTGDSLLNFTASKGSNPEWRSTGGYNNGGYYFNYSEGDYYDLLDDPRFDVQDGEDWTASLWFRPEDMDGTSIYGLFGQTNPSSSSNKYGSWKLYAQSDDLYVSVGNGVTSSNTRCFDAYTNYEWVHLLGKRENNTLFAYANGAQCTNTTISVNVSADTTTDVLIGAVNTVLHYGNGTFDDIYFFDRALSDEEITTLYSSNDTFVFKRSSQIITQTFNRSDYDVSVGDNYLKNVVLSGTNLGNLTVQARSSHNSSNLSSQGWVTGTFDGNSTFTFNGNVQGNFTDINISFTGSGQEYFSLSSEPQFEFVTSDVFSPEITFVTPLDGTNVSNGQLINVSIIDASSISEVVLNITQGSTVVNSTLLSTTDNIYWTTSFDTTSLSDGFYNFTVIANDSNNQVGTSQVQVYSTNFLFNSPLPIEYENQANLTVNVTAVKDSCLVSLDGGSNNSMSGSSPTFTYGLQNLGIGGHNLVVSCLEGATYDKITTNFTSRYSFWDKNHSFVNSDSLTIYYDIFFNSTEVGDLVIATDPWTSTREIEQTRGFAQYFSGLGYFGLAMDTRGKGNSTGTIDASGYECKDIYEGVKNAIERYGDYINDTNLFLYGASGAGGKALSCSGKYPDYWTAVRATSPVANYSAWYDLNPERQATLELRIGGGPDNNTEGYNSRDGTQLGYNSIIPTEVWHWNEDASTNVTMARQYNATMTAWGKVINYTELSGTNHATLTNGQRDNVDEYFQSYANNDWKFGSTGDLFIGGYIVTENFSIELNNVSKTGTVAFRLADDVELNVTTTSYLGSANFTFYGLNVTTNYTLSIDGVNVSGGTYSSDANGELNFTRDVNTTQQTFLLTPLAPGSGPASPSLYNVTLTPLIPTTSSTLIGSAFFNLSGETSGNISYVWYEDGINTLNITSTGIAHNQEVQQSYTLPLVLGSNYYFEATPISSEAIEGDMVISNNVTVTSQNFTFVAIPSQSNFTLRIPHKATLQVNLNDPDGDVVTTWVVESQTNTTGKSFDFYSTRYIPGVTYSIDAVMTDGDFSQTKSWSITVEAGDANVAGTIGLTLFLIAISAFLAILPLVKQFSENELSNRAIRRGLWTVAILITMLNASIMTGVAEASGLPVAQEFLRYVWLFGVAGWVFFMYFAVITLFDIIRLYKIKQYNKRFGG